MKVTNVKIRRIYNESKLKAVASVTLDDEIAIHDIKIIQGENRLFIAMPSRKSELGEYRDIAHPISSSARSLLENAVFSAYSSYIKKDDSESNSISS